jgi:hypothetical protein
VLKPEELKTFMGRFRVESAIRLLQCSGKACNGQEVGEYEKP